jgi:hypothetical protein
MSISFGEFDNLFLLAPRDLVACDQLRGEAYTVFLRALGVGYDF